MSEWRVFMGLLTGPRSDVLVLLSTFGLTVLIDLVVAIQVGVVLAALLFMRRMAEVSQVRSVTDEIIEAERAGFEAENPDVALPEGTEVFEIAGSFFFGAAQRFSEALAEIRRTPRVVILRMRDVFAMDVTGLHALEEVHTRFQRQGITMLLSGVRSQPMMVLVRSGALDRFGEDNVLGSFRDAAERAWVVVGEEPVGHTGPLDRGRRQLLARLVSALLFGVSPLDPPALALAVLTLLAACVSALVLPALRATRVPPSEALRVE